MKRIALAAGTAVIVAGCSFAPLIKSDSIDFAATLDEVSNQLLVTNILRARDHAPLHFADLSALRAQFQLAGSVQTVFPFGAFSRTDPFSSKITSGVGSAATRASNTDVLSLQTSPSFDFSPLDTQEFTRGILTPLDPQVVKYYFDRNMPQELLLFLLIDRVVPARASSFPDPAAPQNASRSVAPDQEDLINDPERPEKFAAFTKWAEGVFGDHRGGRVIVANSYYRQVGPPMEGSTEDAKKSASRGGGDGASGGGQNRNSGSADSPAQKNQVECFDMDAPARAGKTHCNENTKRYKLVTYAEPPETILCAKEKYFFVPLPLVQPDMNDPKVAQGFAKISNLWKQLCTSHFAPSTTSEEVGTVYIRSVETIIQYLGALIGGPYRKQNQDALHEALGYTLFNLSTEPEGERFRVSYGGETYYVRSYDDDDRTMQTLALVIQLLNLNKKASEIPTTRAVEIVP